MNRGERGLTRPVWAEVNLDNIHFNLEQVRRQLRAETMIIAVVKANAYGHGVIPVAEELVEAGAERLAVALPEEGVGLREAGFSLPIHILGELVPEQYPLIIEYGLIPAVARLETLRGLSKLTACTGRGVSGRQECRVHLIIDTGMGRIGVQPDNALEFVQTATELPGITVEGLMTHFARADEVDKEFAYYQWERFNYVIGTLEAEGIEIPIKQAANSAAIIDLPEFQLDMVRPGIMLYGLPPSPELDHDFTLKPVLSWKAEIVFLKEVEAGTPISYGSTYVTRRKSRIATIPLGYADGYSRLLSNEGEVIIRGQRAPIRGRVCMDQFMVDVTEIPDAVVGDEVVLIGRQAAHTPGNSQGAVVNQAEEITAGEMAELIGTINYEITCNISQRVPRIYTRNANSRKEQ